MKYVFRFALTKTPAFSGILPSQGRDLEVSPLTAEEEQIETWVLMQRKTAQYAMNRCGMAFEKLENGNIGRYCGNWYECIECLKRDRTKVKPIHFEWLSGPAITVSTEKKYIETIYDPTKRRDVDRHKTLTMLIGYCCPNCWKYNEKTQREECTKFLEQAKD